MERGEIKNISVFTLLEFCKLFECNIVQLFALAGFDIFETEIKTWTEFFHLQQNISEVDFERIKKLVNIAPLQNQ